MGTSNNGNRVLVDLIINSEPFYKHISLIMAIFRTTRQSILYLVLSVSGRGLHLYANLINNLQQQYAGSNRLESH